MAGNKKDKRFENSEEMICINHLESLNDYLSHHVLSFLSPDEEIIFSILSKSLRSSWLSYPSLDYNFDIFSWKKSSSAQAEFFNYVDKSLQLRGAYIKPLQLEMLKFTYNSSHAPSLKNNFVSIVKKLFEFALENNAKELEVDIRPPIISLSPYRPVTKALSVVLESVFSLQCLTVLKLEGFSFKEPNLNLTSPSVQIFILDSCSGLESIRVSSACRRLGTADIGCCSGLEKVCVGAENVKSFSYVGTGPVGCRLDVSACSDSLIYFRVNNAAVHEFLQHIDGYVLLELLDLRNCSLPTTLKICSSSLITLKLNDCYDVKKLVVSSKNLLSFTYRDFSFVYCRIEVSECPSLTSLQLCGARYITAGWLRDTIQALTMLQELTLKSCTPLEQIEFKHDNLKVLALENFNGIEKTEIDARNLLHFSYSGSIEPFPLVITSSQCNAIVSLKYRSVRWFRKLRKFLKNFNHCPLLTLNCSSAKDLIFPRNYLSSSKFPLPDMKDLIVELANLPKREELVELVESVLWIVPNPETVTIVSGSKRYLLKFHYSCEVSRKEIDVDCCTTRLLKCWRHRVERIDMENFEQEDRNSLEKLLFNDYLRYAVQLTPQFNISQKEE